MTERIAIPAWNAPPTPLAAWVGTLEARLGPVKVERDGPDGARIDLESRSVRGYAMVEGPNIGAVHFEVDAPDPADALRDLEAACAAIGWELHEDDEPDDDEDRNDD